MESELTAPVMLTGARGRLNPDAVGWARTPLIDTAGIDGRRSWGRNKRWEYWNVMTPRHVLALTVASLDYAALAEAWVLDRETERVVASSETLLPSRHVELPATLGDGPARARMGKLSIDIDPHSPGDPTRGTRLRASIPGASFDVTVEREASHECLAVVVPFNRRRFQYTVKDVALRAHGTLTLGGDPIELPGDASWATMDHGRGRWPYDVTWNWGAGAGVAGHHVIGIQVGGKWTDGIGVTENGILIDGRLHKISEELAWSYSRDDVMAPWRVRGGGLDLEFAPFYDRVARTDFAVISSSTDQCFGHWSGSFRMKGGQTVRFTGIPGWTEHVHQRW